MHKNRIDRLNKLVLSQGLDGLAIMPGPNMLYLSGMHTHLSERPILLFIPVDDDPAIIIPDLEASKARAAGVPDERIYSWNDDQGYTAAFQKACAQMQLSGFLLGIESLHMRALELELLQQHAPGLSTTHADPILSALREVKDEGELAAMDRATIAAETAMHNLLPRILTGQSEKQISAMLLQELTEAGSEAAAFNPIVSAGLNSASPHAVPTERPIQSGDLLVIDWGAIIDDYSSDITRTFAVGELEPDLADVYEVVSQANEAARAIARPGASGRDIDRAAREVITAAGYGEFFFHRTGHGLGLEVHESPYIMESNSEPLQTGNVFTIEPGIYLTGRGGVRIEDDIVITPDSSRSLTNFPRHLIEVG